MNRWAALLMLSASLALPAAADPSERRDVLAGATVSKVCRFGGATVLSGQNATYAPAEEGGAIALSLLADRDTARALAANISVTFQGVCNEPQSIRLVSANGGLKQEQGTQGGGGFLNRVDYTATLDWGADNTTLATDGTANGAASVAFSGAQSGAVTLNISIPAGLQPLIAGDYSDVLTVEFVGNL